MFSVQTHEDVVLIVFDSALSAQDWTSPPLSASVSSAFVASSFATLILSYPPPVPSSPSSSLLPHSPHAPPFPPPPSSSLLFPLLPSLFFLPFSNPLHPLLPVSYTHLRAHETEADL
eukprot:2245688-Rhodomonas_salina.1